ncbi:MAG: hypothetical protein FWD71_04880 [Oscillospiraceae bacterium]|nr:hypothetical protein [Oscillospiraceae bacterium]
MNENIKSNTMYETMPEVSGLNRVSGFDPRKFMRKVISELTKQEIMYLDLKYKKLWFRIAYPKGKIKKTALRINEQIAIIEAKVFFNKDDVEPVSTFIAQRNANEKPGYIEAAQYAAENQALVDAGFGLQFCDVSQGPDIEIFDAELPVDVVTSDIKTAMPASENMPIADIVEKTPSAPEADSRNMVIQKTTAAVKSENEIVEQPITSIEQKTVENETDIPDVSNQNNTETGQIQDDITQYSSYTADMPIDEILKIMTLEEAGTITVDVGTCNGWMMSDVMEKRPASLKWYLNGYTGGNNILRASAKMMLDYMAAKKAA